MPLFGNFLLLFRCVFLIFVSDNRPLFIGRHAMVDTWKQLEFLIKPGMLESGPYWKFSANFWQFQILNIFKSFFVQFSVLFLTGFIVYLPKLCPKILSFSEGCVVYLVAMVLKKFYSPFFIFFIKKEIKKERKKEKKKKRKKQRKKERKKN